MHYFQIDLNSWKDESYFAYFLQFIADLMLRFHVVIIRPPTQGIVTEKYWIISIESENCIFQVKVLEMKVVWMA